MTEPIGETEGEGLDLEVLFPEGRARRFAGRWLFLRPLPLAWAVPFQRLLARVGPEGAEVERAAMLVLDRHGALALWDPERVSWDDVQGLVQDQQKVDRDAGALAARCLPEPRGEENSGRTPSDAVARLLARLWQAGMGSPWEVARAASLGQVALLAKHFQQDDAPADGRAPRAMTHGRPSHTPEGIPIERRKLPPKAVWKNWSVDQVKAHYRWLVEPPK